MNDSEKNVKDADIPSVTERRARERERIAYIRGSEESPFATSGDVASNARSEFPDPPKPKVPKEVKIGSRWFRVVDDVPQEWSNEFGWKPSDIDDTFIARFNELMENPYWPDE